MSSASPTVLHLRAETKPLERRSAFPLPHAHIQFGHCHKQQDGWARYLSSFARGSGTLYDIEFLTNENGRRVSAFGYWAGYAGTAIALLAWANSLKSTSPLGPISGYPSEAEMVRDLRAAVSSVATGNENKSTRILIIGALGRCGTGSADACGAAGIHEQNIIKWDMAETSKGGPFPEIAEADVFVNCIYLTQKIPPFVTFESLAKPGRNLRVICDVSCDPNNPNNPVPVYTRCSTFNEPALPVQVEGDGPPLVQVSIDHMAESAAQGSERGVFTGLLPSLLTMKDRGQEGAWVRAERIYKEKVEELPANMR